MVGFLGKGVGEVPHLFQLAQIAIADDVAHRAYVLLSAAVSRNKNTIWLLAWDMGRVECVCPVGVLAAVGFLVFPRGNPATRDSEICHRNTPKRDVCPPNLGRVFLGATIATKTMLVSYSDVSKYEYFRPSVVVIFILSLKNVACGAVLADKPSPRTIAVVAGCIAFLLVLSTLTTMIVSSQTLFVVLTDEAQEEEGMSIHTTGEENFRCATDYKRIQKRKSEKNIRMASPVTDDSTDDELTIMTG